ncbi:MAG: hypothetical protein ABIR29_01965 [Chthoniobacterales bacterium]
MPDNDPIRRLLNSLSEELSQQRLEHLAREFNALAQDRSETLVFFVLTNICQRLASALEGEAVTVDRFGEFTADISQQFRDVLGDIQTHQSVNSNLERLVATLFRNLGLYRR